MKKLKELQAQHNTNLKYTSNYRKIVIKLSVMDSIHHSFDKLFYSDLRLTDSVVKKGQFISNTKIYKLHNKLLKHYDSIYHSEKFIQIVTHKKPAYLIFSDNNNYIAIYQYDDAYVKKTASDILSMRKQLLKRGELSYFLPNLFSMIA